MGRKKYATRGQRQANNDKIEQTQRFENSAQGITKSLDFIKKQNQSIFNATKEIGTVSPGSGLMPGQILNTMMKYQKQYLSFVKDILEPKLREFAKGSKIRVVYGDHKLDELTNKQIYFYRQDDKLKEDALILKDNNSHIGTHYICGEVRIVETSDGKSTNTTLFKTKNNDERQLLRFVIQEFLNDYYSFTSEEFDSLQDTLTVDEVIKRLHSFGERKTLLDFKFQGMSNNCINAINSKIEAHEKKTTADVNSTITANAPEQSDDIDTGRIPVIIGVSIVVGAVALCCAIKWRRSKQRSGSYNMQGAPGCIPSTPKKLEDGYRESEKVGEAVPLIKDKSEQNQVQSSASSFTNISETKSENEEEKPLLSDQEQLDVSNNEVEISDEQLANMQQALQGKYSGPSREESTPPQKPPRMEQTLAEVHKPQKDETLKTREAKPDPEIRQNKGKGCADLSQQVEANDQSPKVQHAKVTEIPESPIPVHSSDSLNSTPQIVKVTLKDQPTGQLADQGQTDTPESEQGKCADAVWKQIATEAMPKQRKKIELKTHLTEALVEQTILTYHGV